MDRRAADTSNSLPTVVHPGLALLMMFNVIQRGFIAFKLWFSRSRRVRMKLILPAGGFLSLCPRAQASVICLEGKVWLTREGDPSDYTLAAPARHGLAGGGRLLIQAVDRAVVRIRIG